MNRSTISAAWLRLTSRVRGDTGASLVLTMVFVMGVGLVVVALLGYAQTSISSAKDTQDRHLMASDGSAAMDVAINALRKSDYVTTVAEPNKPCPTSVTAVSTPGASGEAVRVTCSPKSGSGVSAGIVPITKLNRPGSAVLLLGTSTTETGFSKASNGILRIKGRVYVNTNITVSGSACPGSNCSEITVDQAPVVAKTGCPTDKVFSTVSVNCTSAASPPEGMDPARLTDADVPGNPSTFDPSGSMIAAGYAQPPSAISNLVHQIVPASCPATDVVEFNPGYYDDAVALSNLTTGNCNKRFLFKPGVYYFDFRNEEMPAGSTTVAAGSNEWTISNGHAGFYVIGGTKQNWNASTQTPNNFPGSCVSPLTATTNNEGVQFVFGGSSRMNVKAGNVELCGQYQIDRPALVIYGAKTGATAASQSATPAASYALTPIAAPHVAFSPAAPLAQLASADGSVATATVGHAAGGATTASVRLGGLPAASQIPAGSTLVSAVLHVTHRETNAITSGGNKDSLSVSVTPNPARPGPAPAAATNSVAFSGAVLSDTTTSLTSALVDEVWRYGLSDLRIDYNATAGKKTGSGTVPSLVADLDAAQLVLTWIPPSLRGETTPINGSNVVGAVGGKALIETSGPSTLLYLQGTTYAPLARFDISLNNLTGQVFKSGIIARSLALSVTPSAAFTGPVIEVPDETSSGVNMEVYLAAYICKDSSVCGANPPGTGWRRIGRSSLSLFSGFPVPSNGAREVTVKSWHLLE